MRASPLCCVVLAICASCASPLYAGVGPTSASVLPSGGNGTDPSANVQQQSAGFVQQNQQTANGTALNGAAGTNGTSVSTTAIVAGTAAGAGTGSAGAPGTAKTDVAAPAVPAAPPPPPPTYVSNIKKVTPENPPKGPEVVPVVPVSQPPAAVAEPTTAESPKVETAAATPPVAMTPKPPAPHPQVATNTPPGPVARATPKPAAEAPAGGVAPAPDGLTFYSGVGVAGGLLAFAFAMFVRSQKDEGAGR
jgi:hypothetical protein